MRPEVQPSKWWPAFSSKTELRNKNRKLKTMINIEELTIKQVRELADLFNTLVAPRQDDNPFEVGANYFIRTVTHHHTGKLVRVTPTELVITDAAWIADDGRLTESLQTGNFSEVEMFPPNTQVIIGRGSLIDAVKISTIATSQK